MTTVDLSKLTPPELARVRLSLVEDIAELEKQLDAANAEVLRRLEGTISKEYEGRNIMHGLIRFDYEGVKAAIEVTKKVKWDQSDLRMVSNGMPAEIATRVFDVELSIPEKTYLAMAVTDLPLYTKLGAARTVKYSKPAIKSFQPLEL